METVTTLSTNQQIEEHRKWWVEVAKKNGWYVEPLFVQVWVDVDGAVTDSVSYIGLTRDLVFDA